MLISFSLFVFSYIHLGNSSRIFRTIDGGQSFEQFHPSFPDSNFVSHSVFALSREVAWVARWQVNILPAKVVKTEDGGQSWVEQSFDTYGFTEVFGLHFFDEWDGFAFGKANADGGERLYFFLTKDGGTHWARVEEFPVELNEVQMIFNVGSNFAVVGNRIYIPTSFGRLLVSEGRGLSWSIHTTPVANLRPTNAVAFRDSLHGLLLAASGADGAPFHPAGPSGFRTQDGGLSWTPIRVPKDLETVSYVPGSGGVYMGTRGYLGELYYYISKDDGNSWQEFSSESLRNIQFTAAGSGWAVGRSDRGALYRWEGPPLAAALASEPVQALPYYEGFENGHPQDYYIEAMGATTDFEHVLGYYLETLGVPEHGGFAGIMFNNYFSITHFWSRPAPFGAGCFVCDMGFNWP